MKISCAAPVQRANVEVAVRVAVDGSPEEDVLILPVLGNEVGIGEQIIEDVGIENRFAVQLLAEVVALDGLALLLRLGEKELYLRSFPLERSTLLVLLDLPTVGE